ncbi:MAG: phosphoglycerate kinase [bacterium]|nr:phosphoglycerate kinase [bacterium]
MVGFTKKTIKDIDLEGKTVLLRADYNVPLDKQGKILGEYRIDCSVPTIKYLLGKNCKIVIISHMGRPGGKRDVKYSLKNVGVCLAKKLDRKVDFIDDCIGEQVEEKVKTLKPKEILLLENLRFHKEEKENDKAFAEQLAVLADVFVQDAFGVVHRAHASTDAITKFIPSVAGLLLEKEVTAVSSAIRNPKRPLMTIVGGAKISDKIDVLETFLKTADVLVVGGAMANTFLLAEGIEIGNSIAEKDEVPEAKVIIEKAKNESKNRHFVFYIPSDGVVAKENKADAKTRIVDWAAHIFASVENYPKLPPAQSLNVASDEQIMDVGPFSAAFIAGAMQSVNTVVWNGTLGITETPGKTGPIGPFAHGTELLIEGMLGDFGHRPYSLVGGGDTVSYLEERDLVESFDHVSTGGGASLELIAGKKLPGVEALQDK